jgi:hypothetical protein
MRESVNSIFEVRENTVNFKTLEDFDDT